MVPLDKKKARITAYPTIWPSERVGVTIYCDTGGWPSL